ncbi:hypothetical protein [Micromonospora sp. NPDC051296]|uniref:hypothetical protein n=1 Tax=Micromonospora sp. NPDC051296 TaxID=3155046 RepID=UPI00343A779E
MSGDFRAKTYTYLRTTMVALLVGLAVAVFYQTWRQGFFLSSVSAYYYTPAQGIFVGALIGLGACMIALRGTTDVEDVFLNFGGMFAAVVAIVPTSRGEDYRAAVRACEEASGPLLTEAASTSLDCPTILGLAAATRANVENNMIALLAVGVLGLLATLLFALRDRSRHRVDTSDARKVWWGFGAASIVLAGGGVAFWAYAEWFIDHAHYFAAVGLLACIVIVAMANALRRQRKQRGDASAERTLRDALVGSPEYYAKIAWAMVGVATVGAALMFADVISLFVLEIVVAALFAVFWMVQTVEQLDDEPPGFPAET